MDEPELVHGVVSDIVPYQRALHTDSPGFVSIVTEQTPDNRTGSIIGIDVQSVALIPELAWKHLDNEDAQAEWVANGSVAWAGEREMLEAALRDRSVESTIGWPETDKEHDDIDGHRHPTRAREHIRIVPGSARGKVAELRPIDAVNGDH